MVIQVKAYHLVFAIAPRRTGRPLPDHERDRARPDQRPS